MAVRATFHPTPMKRPLQILAALAALAVPLSAAQAPRTITLGLVAKSQGNPVFQAARVGAEDAAKELGTKLGLTIKIDWRTPNEEDAQKQADAIEQLVLAGAAGISVSVSDANKLTDAINRAVDRGVPVATFDSDAPASKRFVTYGVDAGTLALSGTESGSARPHVSSDQIVIDAAAIAKIERRDA